MIQTDRLQELIDKYKDQLPEDITLEQLQEYIDYHSGNSTEETPSPALKEEDIPDSMKEELKVDGEEKHTDRKPQTTKSRNLKKIILIAIGSLIAAGLLAIAIGTFTYSFTPEKDSATIYLVRGEKARTEIKFKNNSSARKQLSLTFDDGKQRTITEDIDGNKTKAVNLQFSDVSNDTAFTVKYGFLNLKKIEIDVVVVDSFQVGFTNSSISIEDQDGKDISKKKYCTPNNKVTFVVTATNSSNKEFQRDYKFKVNNKLVDKQTAAWKGDSKRVTTLRYTYTFKKQGYYKLNIGPAKINFICSTSDTPPANGTILKNKVSGGMGQMKVDNKNNYPVIVTLCKSAEPDKAQNRIYIKAKSSATMHGITDHKYIIFIKGGKGYSKMAKDILEPQSAFKFNQVAHFSTTATTYSNITITLGITKGGGGTTVPIDDDSIPM